MKWLLICSLTSVLCDAGQSPRSLTSMVDLD